MANKFFVSPSPHIRTEETVTDVMRDVIFALTPAILASIYFFKISAVITLSISIITAVIAEMIAQKLMKKEISINDCSAVVTGILFAFVIPPHLPWWQVIIGSATSILLGKMVFGGLGHNVFNPALIGRSVLMASWPAAMTSWIIPEKISSFTANIDGAAGATPLGILKNLNYTSDATTALIHSFGSQSKMYWDLFIGNVGGSLGETSALALLMGAAILFVRGHITWHTPISYIGTVFVLSFIFGQDPLFHILAGGLILGAFFMATDMVTTPYTPVGKILFGVGAGILVVWIRMKGGYPEGVCYSILIMNAVTPLINKYIKPKAFGEVKKNG